MVNSNYRQNCFFHFLHLLLFYFFEKNIKILLLDERKGMRVFFSMHKLIKSYHMIGFMKEIFNLQRYFPICFTPWRSFRFSIKKSIHVLYFKRNPSLSSFHSCVFSPRMRELTNMRFNSRA